MASIGVDFLGSKLKSPTVLASGILGVTTASMRLCVENGAGAVTMKSITREPRKGHAQPIVHQFPGGLLNAVGYSNPGYEAALEEFSGIGRLGVPVIGSIVAKDADEFAFLAEHFADKLPFAALEIPLSCPHTPGFGTMAGQSTPEATLKITKAVKKKTKLPLIVKLSPNVQNIAGLAKAAETAGADAICAVNSMGPGMLIDISTGKRALGFGMGGVTGAALMPIALRTVYDISQAVKIPIIGTGGVATGEDAMQMLMAGATVVGVGTAVLDRGVEVFDRINEELAELMDIYGYNRIKDIIGVVDRG
ncbi:MAG: dihydroorotate dehydrogenase [archaeon]